MSLIKKIIDKKVNFEFNKEFINVFNKKIKDNDTEFLNKTLKEPHPADSADIIENLTFENRSKQSSNISIFTLLESHSQALALFISIHAWL